MYYENVPTRLEFKKINNIADQISFPFILALTFYIVHCINTKILIIKSFLSFYTKNKNTDHKK